MAQFIKNIVLWQTTYAHICITTPANEKYRKVTKEDNKNVCHL